MKNIKGIYEHYSGKKFMVVGKGIDHKNPEKHYVLCHEIIGDDVSSEIYVMEWGYFFGSIALENKIVERFKKVS